jgi:hypothetical protein
MSNSLFKIRLSVISASAAAFLINFEWPARKESNSTPSAWNSDSFSFGQLPCLPMREAKIFRAQNPQHPDNPYMLMAAAHAAYRFWPGKQARILRSWGFKVVQSFNKNSSSTNGFTAEHDDFLLLAFRGTQEPGDLATDFSVALTPLESPQHSEKRVHQGFKEAAESVWDVVLRTAQSAQEKRKPLFLVGHSLGGAVALLSAQRLSKENLPFESVWSFGAPKVGNESMIQSLKNELGERWKRLNHPDDPIPALPLTKRDEENAREWAQTLADVVPVLNTLAENANYEDEPVSQTVSSVSVKAFSQRSAYEIARGFLEHLPRAYVCNLAKGQLAL